MSEAKFTRGEWRVERFVNDKGFEIAFNDDGEVVADYVYTEPDANLIAAAPKMYEEIERDIDWLTRMIATHGQDHPMTPTFIDMRQDKIAILAKARGE